MCVMAALLCFALRCQRVLRFSLSAILCLSLSPSPSVCPLTCTVNLVVVAVVVLFINLLFNAICLGVLLQQQQQEGNNKLMTGHRLAITLTQV